MKRFGLLATTASVVALSCAAGTAVQTAPGVFPATVVGVPIAQADRPTALMPKSETGADRFLADHGEFDGRGVIVAIFDTGVDPGAPGMESTSDGKPKIIDMVDGSGSGDVDTSTVRTLREDGTIEGLSGRSLTPGDDWRKGSGEYHLGLKPAYELFPGGLVGRLKRERGEDFDESRRVRLEQLQRDLRRWDEAHPSPTREQLKQRDNLEALLEQCREMIDGFDDPGPIFDCIVFHDGETWRAAIDTDEDGDFNDEKLLTNYRLEREFSTFGEKDLLNYALNIYRQGNLLSIVTDCGSHGTHVAGIVAAHYPEQPELNGIAPGAQIVSVKIGDTRLGSRSVGTGSIRGLIAVLQNECDLINMSFGGPTATPNRGRICGLYSEIVNEHGVIFVASAGNSGPGLTTAGGPGGTTEAIIGVGAAVSADMMAEQYSMYEAYDELPYTFSSRGPTTDGAFGPVITAPGGAISPVPNWLLKKNQQSHGTSMSSPNACGSIALLLSALKQEEIAYTPHSVRRAIENTARPIADGEPFTDGAGMIQVDRAWEQLAEYRDVPERDVRFQVSVLGRGNARGIYLREPWENDQPFWSRVTVKPVFAEDADNRAKVAFDMQLNVEATEPWVSVADTMRLMHGGRRFEVRVDPEALDPGVHTAEVLAYDADAPARGPVFRIPVTVVRTIEPEAEDDGLYWREIVALTSGEIQRRFIEIPEGATWAELSIRRLDDETDRLFVAQMIQLLDGRDYSARQLSNYIWLDESAEELRSVAVDGAGTLELALAHYWSIPGQAEYEIDLDFHGIAPRPSELLLPGGVPMATVDVHAPLREETLSPRGSLTTLRRTLRPIDSELGALDRERDRLPKERQIYELILTYEFELAEDATVTGRPSVTWLPVDWDIYESQLCMFFDKNKRLIKTTEGDQESVRLKKGRHTARFHIRHDDPDHLKRLDGMPFVLDQRLKKAVSLQVYDDPYRLVTGGRTVSGKTLPQGDSAVLYVAVPEAKALPGFAEPGDRLVGSLSYGATGADLVGVGRRPGGFPVSMTVPPKARPEEKPKAVDAEAADDRGELEKLAEEIRDLKVARLGKLHGEDEADAFDALAAEVLDKWPDHLPVLMAQLKRADRKKGEGETEAIVTAADRVIEQIDREELAAFFGVSDDNDDPDATRRREQMNEEKGLLVEALFRKARALLHAAEQGGDEEDGIAAFDAAFDDLRRWADAGAKKYLALGVGAERLHGRLGEALALVNKRVGASPLEREPYERRIELLEELGWDDWAELERRWLLRRFPKEYPPF